MTDLQIAIKHYRSGLNSVKESELIIATAERAEKLEEMLWKLVVSWRKYKADQVSDIAREALQELDGKHA